MNHGPEGFDAGTVCAIDAPSVVPAAFDVVIDGLIVSAPVAAVVMAARLHAVGAAGTASSP
jgi:hypothetical protein